MTNKKLKIVAISAISLLIVTTALSIALAVIVLKPKPLGWQDGIAITNVKSSIVQNNDGTYNTSMTGTVKNMREGEIASITLWSETIWYDDDGIPFIDGIGKSYYNLQEGDKIDFSMEYYNLKPVYSNQPETLGALGLRYSINRIY